MALRLSRPKPPETDTVRLGTWVRVPVDAVDMAVVRGDLSLRNPEFWLAHEHGEPTEGMEPFIRLYRGGEEGDRYVWLPRQYKVQLVRDLPVVHQDLKFPKCKHVTCNAKPRSFVQERAMEAFAGHQDGILCLAAGTGKAQPLRELVLTPKGWRKMSRLRVGDYVIGSDGKPTEIEAVYPQGEKDVYRVTMYDGGYVDCTEDHLWSVRDPNLRSRYRHKPSLVLTVRQMLDAGIVCEGGKRLKFSLPYSKPVEFCAPAESLPLHPYVLGLWLGDGSTGKVGTAILHNPETDIVEKFRQLLPDGDMLILGNLSEGHTCPAYRVRRVEGYERMDGRKWDHSATAKILKKLGLAHTHSYERFIPKQYLRASVAERWELLRGLFDADGFVTGDCKSVEYMTTSADLRDGVQELAKSLGARVTWVTKKTHYKKNGVRTYCRDAYRMMVSFPEGGCTPVSSQKHLAKWSTGAARTPHRYIESINKLPSREQCQCIQVAAADGLYVTRDYIVTHNTKTSLMVAAAGQKFPLLVVVHTTALLDQWRKEIAATYSMEESDIGVVRGSKCQFYGRTVAVAMLQSLVSKQYPKEFYKHWRLIVFDEVHRCVGEGSLVRMGDGTQVPVESVRVGDEVLTPLGPRTVTRTSKSLRLDVVLARVGQNRLALTPDHLVAGETSSGSKDWLPIEAAKKSYALAEECLPGLCSLRSADRAGTQAVQGQHAVPHSVPSEPLRQELQSGRYLPEVRQSDPVGSRQRGPLRPLRGQRQASSELASTPGRGRDTVEGVRGAVEGVGRQASALALREDAPEQPIEVGPREKESLGEVAAGWDHGEGRARGFRSRLWRERLCRYGERGPSLEASKEAGLLSRSGLWHSCERKTFMRERQELLRRFSVSGQEVDRGDRREQSHWGGPSGVEQEEGRLLFETRDRRDTDSGDLRSLRTAASGLCDLVETEVLQRGITSNVYDLTVEEASCFFANNVLVHNCGSQLWAQVVSQFPGQRMGLTATPERPDGLDKAFRVHLGKIRYKYTKQALSAKFFFVHTGLRFGSPAARNPIRRWAIVMSTVGKSEERNWFISEYLEEMHAQGRNVIVLGERVSTLKHLYRAYPGKDKSLFVGDTPAEERRPALEKKAIFATANMAKEGLDVPRLDTLFITIPFSGLGRLEQSVGRILRIFEGKKEPHVYVFVDDQRSIQRNANVQRQWALSKNYEVEDIYRGKK